MYVWSPSCLPFSSSAVMLGLPAAATNVGNQSMPDTMPFSTLPAGTLPGQRRIIGTRKPPSSAVPLPPANGVWPPSGQVKFSAPLSVVKPMIVSSSRPLSFRYFITEPTMSSICAMPASWMVQLLSELRSALYFGDRCVTTCMRVGLSQTKNGLLSARALSMNLSVKSRISSSTVSIRFGQSSPASSIFCLPIAPQRGCTVESSALVAHECTMLRAPTVGLQRLRVSRMAMVFHRVEVIEVAEELVEAVHRRQELVQVAQVVLAELPGGVAHRLQRGGDRRRLRRHADRRARLADRREAGADRQLAGDEVGAARGAARFGVVVGEAHAFGREPVEVRRAHRHDALVVGADVRPADVVAHDHDDVGLLARRLSKRR